MPDFGHVFTDDEDFGSDESMRGIVEALNKRLKAVNLPPITTHRVGTIINACAQPTKYVMDGKVVSGNLSHPLHVRVTTFDEDHFIQGFILNVDDSDFEDLSVNDEVRCIQVGASPNYSFFIWPMSDGVDDKGMGKVGEDDFVPAVSWFTLQNIVRRLGLLYTDPDFDWEGVGADNVLDYIQPAIDVGMIPAPSAAGLLIYSIRHNQPTWPNFSRKVEKEINKLDDPGDDGDVARFIYKTGTSLHDEKKYSLRVMERVSGEWVNATDRLTQPDEVIITGEEYPNWGAQQPGDMIKSHVPNELTASIQQLTKTFDETFNIDIDGTVTTGIQWFKGGLAFHGDWKTDASDNFDADLGNFNPASGSYEVSSDGSDAGAFSYYGPATPPFTSPSGGDEQAHLTANIAQSGFTGDGSGVIPNHVPRVFHWFNTSTVNPFDFVSHFHALGRDAPVRSYLDPITGLDRIDIMHEFSTTSPDSEFDNIKSEYMGTLANPGYPGTAGQTLYHRQYSVGVVVEWDFDD